VGYVAYVGEVRGVCRVRRLKGRNHFGDIDVCGRLLQCWTNMTRGRGVEINVSGQG
jgi:hypothetical protein